MILMFQMMKNSFCNGHHYFLILKEQTKSGVLQHVWKVTANTYPAICLHYYILQIICCEAHFYICDTSNLMLRLLPEREIAGITVCNIIGMLPAAPTSILIIMSSNLSDFGMNLIQSHSNTDFPYVHETDLLLS
jgi:hypothetical protein